MKRLLILMAVLSFMPYAFAQDVNLSVGAAKGNPNLHQAVYNLLDQWGIGCAGLKTDKSTGNIIIINPSVKMADDAFSESNISDAITAIQTDKDNEAAIQAQIQLDLRANAVSELQSSGVLSQNFVDKKAAELSQTIQAKPVQKVQPVQ